MKVTESELSQTTNSDPESESDHELREKLKPDDYYGPSEDKDDEEEIERRKDEAQQ